MIRRMYTKQELDEMRQLKRQGATYEEIARMFNRSAMAVQVKFSELGWTNDQPKRKDEPETDTVTAQKKQTLDDFTPRELIKYLYNLGYRIENNKLVYVHRKVINIKSVLED